MHGQFAVRAWLVRYVTGRGCRLFSHRPRCRFHQRDHDADFRYPPFDVEPRPTSGSAEFALRPMRCGRTQIVTRISCDSDKLMKAERDHVRITRSKTNWAKPSFCGE